MKKWLFRLLEFLSGPALIVLFIWFLTPSAAETRETEQRSALARSSIDWGQCSQGEIRQHLSTNQKGNANDILVAVLAKCQTQYDTYRDLNARSGYSREDVRVTLSKTIEKSIKESEALKEKAQKAELIEAAIEQLAKAGVTEEDIRDYFREEIEEDR